MIERIDRRILLYAACFLLPSAAAEAQKPVLVLGDGTQEVDRLVVGEDLWVDLPGFVPEGRVEIRLRWPSGEVIAAIPFDGDAPGVPPGDDEEPAGKGGTLLWQASGVMGCDCDSGPLPGERFADFEEAEQALGGQILEVAVVDQDEQELASTELPAVAPPEGRIYFSDSMGCRRNVFGSDEEIWVTMLRPPFLRPSDPSLVLSAPADLDADVRGAAQTVSLPQYGARLMVKVDDRGLAVPGGPYFGFVNGNDANGDATSVVVQVPSDSGSTSNSLQGPVVGGGVTNPNGGITITMDSCIPDRP